MVAYLTPLPASRILQFRMGAVPQHTRRVIVNDRTSKAVPSGRFFAIHGERVAWVTICGKITIGARVTLPEVGIHSEKLLDITFEPDRTQAMGVTRVGQIRGKYQLNFASMRAFLFGADDDRLDAMI